MSATLCRLLGGLLVDAEPLQASQHPSAHCRPMLDPSVTASRKPVGYNWGSRPPKRLQKDCHCLVLPMLQVALQCCCTFTVCLASAALLPKHSWLPGGCPQPCGKGPAPRVLLPAGVEDAGLHDCRPHLPTRRVKHNQIDTPGNCVCSAEHHRPTVGRHSARMTPGRMQHSG